jgi:hypothetical protein
MTGPTKCSNCKGNAPEADIEALVDGYTSLLTYQRAYTTAGLNVMLLLDARASQMSGNVGKETNLEFSLLTSKRSGNITTVTMYKNTTTISTMRPVIGAQIEE